MKTALLLEKLEGQLATLRQRCAPVSQFATLSARFDRHLFQTRATTLQACLDEAGDACEFAIACEKEEAAERTRRAENGYENQKYRLHLHGHLPVPR